VDYEINPWMHVENKPIHRLAEQQWDGLIKELKSIGADLHFLEPVDGFPDMVFTANGAAIVGNKAVAPKMRYSQRSGEEKYFIDWLTKNQFEVFVPSVGCFEGEGDMFLMGDKLFCGYGFRSTKDAYSDIAEFLGVKNIVYCELANPSFYHLDTCFLPLGDDLAMVHEPAFTAESLKEIKKNIRTIVAPPEDAKHFACNSVRIGNKIVIPDDCKKTEEILHKHGFETHAVALTEFIKAGGAAKCLSLKLGK
jgi:N-dimethylarginine dimethylaminohydrolase